MDRKKLSAKEQAEAFRNIDRDSVELMQPRVKELIAKGYSHGDAYQLADSVEEEGADPYWFPKRRPRTILERKAGVDAAYEGRVLTDIARGKAEPKPSPKPKKKKKEDSLNYPKV